MNGLDPIDRRLIAATQAGLPLVAAPYAQIAGQLGVTEAEVIFRLTALQDLGIIRRIAIAPGNCHDQTDDRERGCSSPARFAICPGRPRDGRRASR